MYISITRLKLKSIWALPKFGSQSNKVARQAKTSPGLLKVKLSNRWLRYFYTITHWESKEAMQQFMTHGDHKNAMQQWSKYASEVKAFGYETDTPPKMKEARIMIKKQGRITH